MTTLVAVVIQVLAEPFVTIGSCLVLLEIDLLVFHGSPKSFDHHVVDRYRRLNGCDIVTRLRAKLLDGTGP